MNIKDLIITSVETITVFGLDGSYKFTLDELQSATIANTLDKEDVTGKGGRKLTSLKRNKGATVSGTNGMISSGLLGMQAGSEVESGEYTILWTDYFTADGTDSATTSYKAVGTAGAEILHLYTKNSDGTLGDEYTQGASAEDNKFTYNPSTKKITFATGKVSAGTELVAYYMRKVQSDKLVNESDKFSGKGQIYVDALTEDKCGNIYRAQFYFPKADFNGEYSLEFGDSQSVHEFEAEALSGACGTKGELWTYTVFGVDAEDAA